LNAVVAAQHRQYQMAVSEGVMVEDQCFVVDDGHAAMVPEPVRPPAPHQFLVLSS
jgi:hypothetical protein